MKVVYTPSFLKSFRRYNKAEKIKIRQTLQNLFKYVETQEASFGLRVKKLIDNIYEVRISIRLRIAYYKNQDVIRLFCLGNHNDIKRALKTFRD